MNSSPWKEVTCHVFLFTTASCQSFSPSLLQPLHRSLLFCPPTTPIRALLVYKGDSRSFLMSCEMWSRDHRETGRHRPSSDSHHSSIIHALISGTFILKWYSIFHVPKQHVAAFILTKDICVSGTVKEFSVHWSLWLWGWNQFMLFTVSVSNKRSSWTL